MIDSSDFGTKLCRAMNIEPDMVREIVITIPVNGLAKVDVHALVTREMVGAVDWQEFVNGAYVNIYCHEAE